MTKVEAGEQLEDAEWDELAKSVEAVADEFVEEEPEAEPAESDQSDESDESDGSDAEKKPAEEEPAADDPAEETDDAGRV